VATSAALSDGAARLTREAQILAQLEHPGIVPVHDVGELPDGRTFYVMKYVRGHRLDRHLAQPLSLLYKLQVFERICETVAFAHARGVIHRDLKPENVMVAEFGEVLVLDWGLARTKSDGDSAGTIAGTEGYMAPEQSRGTVTDNRSDVFALGAILDFVLASESAPPRPLLAVARKATQQDPNDRYERAMDVAADLNRYREGLPVDAYRESWLERGGRVARKHQLPLALVAAYVVMRIILLLFSDGS
jgi:serine/threonine protein kinase